MRSISIFCILLLQIILFVQPTVSQLDQDRIRNAFVNAGLLPNEGAINYGYSVAQPMKPRAPCSTIGFPLDLISFLIDICFDNSSKELDAKLKAEDVDLGQAKGTFDGGVLISFDDGKSLNGHHRYYVKGNELWLRYSNMIFGKIGNGDFKLRSLPFISSGILDAPTPEPEPKEDEPEPEPELKKDEPMPKPKPKKDEPVPKPKPKEDEPMPKPEPKEDEPMPKPEPKEDEPMPKPKKATPMPKPKKAAPKPKPKKAASKSKPKKAAPKSKSKGNAPKPKLSKKNASKPKPIRAIPETEL